MGKTDLEGKIPSGIYKLETNSKFHNFGLDLKVEISDLRKYSNKSASGPQNMKKMGARRKFLNLWTWAPGPAPWIHAWAVIIFVTAYAN